MRSDMTKMCSEQGSLVLKTKSFTTISKHITSQYNIRQDTLLALAVNIYNALSVLPRSQQHPTFLTIQRKNNGEMALSCCGDAYWGESQLEPFLGKVEQPKNPLTASEFFYMEKELFRGKNESLCKPRKSAYRHAPLRCHNEITLDCHAVSITLDKTSSRITWEVNHGNNAIDDMEACFVGKSMLAFLDNFQWQKNEGGCAYQSIENEQCHTPPATLNRHWGPVGEATFNNTY